MVVQCAEEETVTDHFHGEPHATSVHEPLSVARLIEEPPFRNARVSGDGARLDAAVTWCMPWAQVVGCDEEPLDGVLVYAHGAEADLDGVRSLEERRAAGLVIAGASPHEFSTQAMPVISTGAEIGFRQVNRLVAELMLAREAHVLRYGLNVHRTLAELLYRGAGLAALCHEMARLSRCAVGILDPQYRVLTFDKSHAKGLDTDAVAAGLRNQSLLAVEPGSARPAPSVLVVRLEDDGLSATCIVTPILLSGRHEGWVVVVEGAEPPHPHDIAEHRVVVEQAATIVGTEMLRMRSVEQAEERARGDFVHALLHGRFSNAHDLEARAVHYGFSTSATYGVIVAGSIGTAGATESLNALFQLARDATRLAPHSRARTLATVVGDVLAVIREIDVPSRPDSPDAGSRALAEYAATLEVELARRIHRPVPVAYGRPVAGANRIFDSYREARIALGLGQRLGIRDPCGFQDLRVFAALADLAASPQGLAFASEVLAPLRGGRPGASELEQALIAYIEFGGNLNAASRELHIHRNTMLYKVDRAARLLQLDLRLAENQFTVWLAYKLDLLAETTAAVDRDVRPT